MSMLTGLKVFYLCHLKVYFTDQNIVQRGEPRELSLEGPEMQKWNMQMDKAQRFGEKMGSFLVLSCLLLELWSLKCQK